jgi:hypothetical protein
MGKMSGSGSGMKTPDHISESLEAIFLLKYSMRIRDGKKSDPEWKKSDPESGINIPDPQH